MSTGKLSLDKKRKIKEKIEILRQDTRNVDLWLELESLFDDPDKKREILMGVLVIDAQNSEALQRLNSLTGIDESAFSIPDSPEDQMPEQGVSVQKEKPFGETKDGWQFEDSGISSENGDEGSVEAPEENLQEDHETISHKNRETEFSGWLKTAIIIFIVLGVITVLGMFIWMIIPLI